MWGDPAGTLAGWKEQLSITATDVEARPVFVAELEGALSGFYSLTPGTPDWKLDNLWVAPAQARCGIGTALLRHSLVQARLGGAARVLVDADPNAEPFYLHCGAVRTGEDGPRMAFTFG